MYARNLQSINSDKHLPQNPFTGQFFKMTIHLLLFTSGYTYCIFFRQKGEFSDKTKLEIS
jgi:hypothetical protein